MSQRARSETSPRSERSTADEIARLGPWFHNLHLPDGSQTAPEHPLGDFPGTKWRVLAEHIPDDLTGKTALDIGCNAGFYSFELARRGARVVSIDTDVHYLDQARWATERLGLRERIEFRKSSVYELARVPEQFDVVLFMGVFYHLRHPLLALDIVASKVKSLLVFQTLTMPGVETLEPPEDIELMDREPLRDHGWPRMAFIERRMAGDPTNWWAASHAGVLALLRSSGLSLRALPGHEIYVCAPDPARDAITAQLAEQELREIFGARLASR
jgi:tRNA (mo5U34)-methyltransferase